MVDIEKLDNELYGSIYGKPRKGNYNEIWTKIVSNPKILKEAVKVVKDKFNEHDIVKGLTIADQMLIFYNDVDKEAYSNLINSIYTNVDVARLVLDGASNGGYSYLLMSLWNHDLKLTSKQKEFAIDEAMNKIGTTRYKSYEESFSKKLDDMGISDDNTTIVEFEGSKNPVGQKTASMYMNGLFSSLSNTQAHGTGEFDIRYHILNNPNWSKEEKEKLVYDFYAEDEDYMEHLDCFKWGVLNAIENLDDVIFAIEDIMYDENETDYNKLRLILKDNENIEEIINGIKFYKMLISLRPKTYEGDKQKVLK